MKEKLLKYSDILVGVLAVICLYAILQIKFDIAFWLGSSKNADTINEVLTNLSYSYLAGFIFYLLTVSLPNWKMKAKLREALIGKLNLIQSNYNSCIESVLPITETNTEDYTLEMVKEKFRGVSYMAPCKLSQMGQDCTIASYIKIKHEENLSLAGQILDYKSWLSSESIAFIEELRNSDISKVITAITLPPVKSLLDKEDTREKLATQVYGLWNITKEIKNLKEWKKSEK